MVDPETGEPHTAHTLNPVPFILADPATAARSSAPGRPRRRGADALEVMGMPQPKAMKGLGLVQR